ncbi:uncharacterized protein [Drosophila takahashii]|uniref:uncharacterized protein n=1 Tax=Drosophila takahashii TaxID=29030 RepID=UPI001CF90C3A|nr:uncharacterized protein LOC108065494 [Drosophila takahashii]
MASYSYKNRAQEMIKCFCGCSDISVADVLRIQDLFGRVKDTLANKLAAKLFRQFMEQRRRGDKNETQQYLDIYEKCVQLEAQPIVTPEDFNELSKLGLPRDLEKDLKDNRMEINQCLIRIQVKCCNEIEASDDFHDFKLAIAKKLKCVPEEMK